MTHTRRDFWRTLGVAVAAPTLWQTAEAEVQDTGAVSVDTARLLLEARGVPGIYADPERLAELRAAITRVIRTNEALRQFDLDDDVQPAVILSRG